MSGSKESSGSSSETSSRGFAKVLLLCALDSLRWIRCSVVLSGSAGVLGSVLALLVLVVENLKRKVEQGLRY